MKNAGHFENSITMWFREAAQSLPVNSELKLTILKMDQTPPFLKRLTKALMDVQDLRIRQGKPMLKDKTIKDTVFDFTELYLRGVEHEVARRDESALAKSAREKEEAFVQDMENTTQGNPTGIFKELGVIYEKDEEIKQS